jgi:hypothetical protein
MAKAEGTSILETPTYYVVAVLLAIVLISSVFDKVGALRCLGTYLLVRSCEQPERVINVVPVL